MWICGECQRVEVPISVAARFRVYICGRLFARIARSNPAAGLVVCVVCVCGTLRKKAKNPGHFRQINAHG
jgi:hypothetical protein